MSSNRRPDFTSCVWSFTVFCFIISQQDVVQWSGLKIFLFFFSLFFNDSIINGHVWGFKRECWSSMEEFFGQFKAKLHFSSEVYTTAPNHLNICVCVRVCVPYAIRSVSSWSCVGLFYNFSLSPPTCKSGWTSGPWHPGEDHKCGTVVQKCMNSSLVLSSLSSRCFYLLNILKIYRNFPLFHVNCHSNVCTFVLASMM